MLSDPTVIKEGPLKFYSCAQSKCSKNTSWRDVYCRLRLSGWIHWYPQAKSNKPILGADLKVVSAYIAYGELLRNVMVKPPFATDYDMPRMFVVPTEPSELSDMNFFLCANDADMSSWISSIFNVLDKPVPDHYRIASPAAAYENPRSPVYDLQPMSSMNMMNTPGDPSARSPGKPLPNPSARSSVPATPPPPPPPPPGTPGGGHAMYSTRNFGTSTPSRRSTATQSPCMLAIPQSTVVCRVVQPQPGNGAFHPSYMQPVAYSVFPFQTQAQPYTGTDEELWGMDCTPAGANEVRQSRTKTPKEATDHYKVPTKHFQESKQRKKEEEFDKEETPSDTLE